MTNLAIVGTGMMADIIAKSVSEIDTEITVYAVLSRDEKKAKEFGRRFSIPECRCYNDKESFFTDNNIDSVYIATPTSEKEKYLSYCIERNKHVLIEKPLPVSKNSIYLYELAKQDNLVIMDATHCVHNSIFDKLEYLIDSYVGDIENIEVKFCWPSEYSSKSTKMNRELEPLGAMGDLGWYTARLLIELTKGNFKKFSHVIQNDAGTIIESRITGYSGLTSFSLFSSYRGHTATQQAIISGSKGEIIINDFIMPYWGSFVYGDVQRYTDVIVRFGMKPYLDLKKERIYFSNSQHIEMINNFCNAINSDDYKSRAWSNFNKSISTAKFLNDSLNNSIKLKKY
ncbi:oxidoreductase [Vibrio variabilis]|uniref:Oxidoreductase n=1 Tax=Vibrio variabilis TaxID=990271 RepID=A0ABQ0JGB0_9VIBR|nr:oxidoreductase [Vibrio variabilis]